MFGAGARQGIVRADRRNAGHVLYRYHEAPDGSGSTKQCASRMAIGSAHCYRSAICAVVPTDDIWRRASVITAACACSNSTPTQGHRPALSNLQLPRKSGGSHRRRRSRSGKRKIRVIVVRESRLMISCAHHNHHFNSPIAWALGAIDTTRRRLPEPGEPTKCLPFLEQEILCCAAQLNPQSCACIHWREI